MQQRKLIHLTRPQRPHRLLAPQPLGTTALALSPGAPLQPSGPAPTQKSASWLDTIALVIVFLGGLWCVYAHTDIAADVSAKVSTAREQLAAPLAPSPAGSSCGIPNSERDAFNTGWEVGHAAR